MVKTRVKVVVCSFKVSEYGDTEIAYEYQQALNSALSEVYGLGGEFAFLRDSSEAIVDENGDEFLTLTATIGYLVEVDANEEDPFESEDDDEEDEEVLPELASGHRKITAEVFKYVKANLKEGLTAGEISNLFDDDGQKLSADTIKKIGNTRKFSEYYAN